MSAFHGIQVYEILDNGNLLNAVYANTDLKNEKKEYIIDSEIARKATPNGKGVEGDYYCRYIETDNDCVISCFLQISKGNNGVYEFTWSQGEKSIWKGLGLMSGTSHIAVSYTRP